MATFTRDCGTPGTAQWERYFNDFSTRMGGLREEIRQAVTNAVTTGQGAELNTVTSAIAAEDIQNEAARGQGAGDAELSPSSNNNVEGENKRAAEKDSEIEPSPKR